MKLFDAEAVGNPICCNPVDCVCWSLLVVLLIVTYFLTRALPSQTLQRVFHDALGSCCMAKPLVLPGLVLRLLTLKSCTVSLQVTWQNMKFHAKSIVKTPDDKLKSKDEVDQAATLNMRKRLQQQKLFLIVSMFFGSIW